MWIPFKGLYLVSLYRNGHQVLSDNPNLPKNKIHLKLMNIKIMKYYKEYQSTLNSLRPMDAL